MSYETQAILSLLIIVTAVIGLVRLKQISPVYLPFLSLIWIGTVNTISSQILLSNGYYNIYNYNTYQLFESFLILLQFRRWQLFEHKSWFNTLCVSFAVVYLVDIIFLTGFHSFNSYYCIFYATIIVLLSINMINKLLITERGNLLKHPIFLICSGFILFFTFNILTEIFLLYGDMASEEFSDSIHKIFLWASWICNLIYIFAILWMPRRHAFSLPY